MEVQEELYHYLTVSTLSTLAITVSENGNDMCFVIIYIISNWTIPLLIEVQIAIQSYF